MRVLSVTVEIFNAVELIRIVGLLLLRLFCELVNRLISFCFLRLLLLKLIGDVDFIDGLS